MQSKSLIRVLALLLFLAVTISLTAKPIGKNISLGRAARFGAVQLDAGDYRLLVDGTTVTIKKGSKVVAQVQGQWEQRPAKSENDSVLIDGSGEAKEIRFRGSNRVLVLGTQ